eukprot:PhF_6_TR15096/c0_g1_i2/m.23756
MLIHVITGFFILFWKTGDCVSPHSAGPTTSSQRLPPKPHAWVTIYYETGKYDYEYLLGLRVMMKSFEKAKTDADRIVLVSPDTCDEIQTLLRSDGLEVRTMENIANPYSNKQQRFLHVLNKLHAWSMTEYRRVVMLDADILAIKDPDRLFSCGAFCAVYLNAVSFHTALLVVKPDMQKYTAMVRALHSNSYGSYDGADQGFLNSYFPLQTAPLFNVQNVTTATNDTRYETSDMMRLPVHANINHVYFYERMTWDGAYGGFASVVTMTFPITQILKPWCWHGYPIFTIHWLWHEHRMCVDSYGNYMGSWCMLLGVSPLMFVFWKWMLPKYESTQSGKVWLRTSCGLGPCQCLPTPLFLRWYGITGAIWIATCAVTVILIPCYVPPLLAWSLLVVWHSMFMYVVFQFLAIHLTLRQMTTTSADVVLMLVPYVVFWVLMTTPIYNHFVWKFAGVALCMGVWMGTLGIVVLRKLNHLIVARLH